ncbi:unnamed protein product, partial [marine sediment metagenome]
MCEPFDCLACLGRYWLAQLAMGHASSHGTWVNLYVNGLYWGLFNPVERP